MMDVSIIIVNWNTCDRLRACVRSIYEQTRQLFFEVIVVDNASSDQSVEMLKREFPAVILIENDANEGFAKANNKGMAVGQGRHLLILNPDTVVLDNALKKTVDLLDAHSKVAVLGCKVLHPDRTLQRTCSLAPSLLNMILAVSYLYKIFPRHRFFARERMGWWDHADHREVDIVSGCFMLVRASVLKDVGLMDEDLFLYAEEWDWCLRFRKAGWKVMFTPEGEIIHYGHQSTDQIGPRACVLKVKSNLYYFRKHHSAAGYVAYRFLIGLFYALRLPFWLTRSFFPGEHHNKMIVRTYWSIIALAWFDQKERS